MATTADAGVLEVATLNVRAGQAAAFEAAFAQAQRLIAAIPGKHWSPVGASVAHT